MSEADSPAKEHHRTLLRPGTEVDFECSVGRDGALYFQCHAFEHESA